MRACSFRVLLLIDRRELQAVGEHAPRGRRREAQGPVQDGGAGVPVRAAEQPQLYRHHQSGRPDVPAPVPAKDPYDGRVFGGDAQEVCV